MRRDADDGDRDRDRDREIGFANDVRTSSSHTKRCILWCVHFSLSRVSVAGCALKNARRGARDHCINEKIARRVLPTIFFLLPIQLVSFESQRRTVLYFEENSHRPTNRFSRYPRQLLSMMLLSNSERVKRNSREGEKKGARIKRSQGGDEQRRKGGCRPN